MQRLLPSRIPSSGLAGLMLLALPALSHEGDPKLLDQQAPYMGKGLRTGLPTPGHAIGPKAGISFPASNVTLLSWLAPTEMDSGASAGNDCWGYVSPSGREYALMGLSNGTAIVEITQPNSPQQVAFFPGPVSTWRDIKVFGTYVYAVSEGGGSIQIFDVSSVDQGIATQVATSGTANTHNVAIDTDSGFLYRTGGTANGLAIYDLNVDPESPALVGTWPDKYVHDAQVVTFTSGPAAGKQVAFCCTNLGSVRALTMLDVTNKSAISIMDEVTWPQAAYSHQVWLSEDGQYAYLNDEGDENGGSIPTRTWVMDVADPSNASLLGSFTNGNVAIGHNLYVAGEQVFEANYSSGLRVFDTSVSPTNPPEVAWFDTAPAGDVLGFSGLWSNYPLFPSGLVIGSDMQLGLFVWWVGPTPIEILPSAAVPSLVDPAGQSLTFDITELVPGNLVLGSPTLHLDAGAGVQSSPLVPLGGSSYRADLPALACGSSLDFFVTAESSNGIVWSWPAGGASNAVHANAALGEVVALEDNLEVDLGWTAGVAGDDATTGLWERVDPVGTGTQPEDDHTPGGGVNCWVTGQGTVGGSQGADDVDGGTTTLVSPAMDATPLSDPVISYWRWYANTGATDDTFVVQVSNGGAWVDVEVLGPGGSQTQGGWIQHTFALNDFVAPSASIQLRFQASDLGAGSIVEAAIDDLQLKEFDCSGVSVASTYCTGKITSALCIPDIGWVGTPSATSGLPFLVTCSQVVAKNNGILFYGNQPAATPFQGGLICAAPPVTRTGAQASGGNVGCEGSFGFDFNALIAAGTDASLVPGAQVNGQYWFRDPPASFGSGLSNAIEFVIQP